MDFPVVDSSSTEGTLIHEHNFCQHYGNARAYRPRRTTITYDQHSLLGNPVIHTNRTLLRTDWQGRMNIALITLILYNTFLVFWLKRDINECRKNTTYHPSDYRRDICTRHPE
jgi:hypothetical protein